MGNLAMLMEQQGDLAGSQALTEQLLDIQQRVFGPNHSSTLETKESLAFLFEAQGSTAAAQALRSAVLSAQLPQAAGTDQAQGKAPELVFWHEGEDGLDVPQFRLLHRTSIKTLKLTEFRCFESLEADLADPLTVFIAPNGAGKTSLLDAIAVAAGQFLNCFHVGQSTAIRVPDVRLLSTNPDLRQMEPQYPTQVTVEGMVDGKPLSWSHTRLSSDVAPTLAGAEPIVGLGNAMQAAVTRNQTVVLPLVAYYGTNRLRNQIGPSEDREGGEFGPEFFSRTTGYKDCLDPASNFKDFEKWFAFAVEAAKEDEEDAARKGQPAADPARGFAALAQAVCDAVDTCLATSGWHEESSRSQSPTATFADCERFEPVSPVDR